MYETASTIRWEDCDAATLAARLGVPGVVLLDRVASTMDVAHEIAATGAPAGTVVLAEEQTAGRGRQGKRWHSAPGAGIWLTLVERPDDPDALDLLSLRLGIALAAELDAFAGETVGVKWPNDLRLAAGKLAGLLVEMRWREGRPDWVAIGLGLNVRSVEEPGAAALPAGVSRLEVLARVVPAMRAAAARRGPLGHDELAAFAQRDVARGRRARAPAAGRVSGIDAQGCIVIDTESGERHFRSGSLLLVEDP